MTVSEAFLVELQLHVSASRGRLRLVLLRSAEARERVAFVMTPLALALALNIVTRADSNRRLSFRSLDASCFLSVCGSSINVTFVGRLARRRPEAALRSQLIGCSLLKGQSWFVEWEASL